MLSARATLQAQYAKLHKAVLAIVGEDAVCRRLITVPGVGPVVAVTFKSAVDDPSRIAKSKAVGALFGLTPKKYQSGEKDVTGAITRTGDEMVRTALYEAANVLLSRWPDNIHDRSRIRHQSHSGPEMGICSHRGAARQWSRLALVVVPGFILSPLWV